MDTVVLGDVRFPTAAEWAALWAFGTMVATFAMVLVGIGTLCITAVAAFAALRQFRAYIVEQEERARPYVVVDFEFRSVLLYVTVENVSSALATNVRMTARPMLKSTMDGRDDVLSNLLGGSFVIPQLAPGRKMNWLADRTADLFARDDMPHRIEVEVEYGGPRGRGGSSQYRDTFILDLDQYGQASGDQDYENKNWNIATRNEKRFGKVVDSLSDIGDALETLTETETRHRNHKPVSRPHGPRRARLK